MRLLPGSAGSGKTARKSVWAGDGVPTGLRALSLLVAAIVAVVTLLPSRSEQRFSLLAEGRAVGDQLNAAMVLSLVAMLALVLVLGAWKSRLAWRFKMSWPLFLIALLYLAGLAMLISTPLRGAVYALFLSSAPEWLRSVSANMDAEHAVAYAAFTVIVAIAWREKVGLPWLALGLFAYGYLLETAQMWVPGRDFTWGDLAANGLGIAIGVVGVRLFDLRASYGKARGVPVPSPERRHSAHRSRRRSRRLPRATNAAMITILAGALIAMASILVAAVAEIRFAEVGWQIFTQFSAPYAFTFWLGVVIAGLGCYQLRAAGASPRRGVRVRSSRSELAPRGSNRTEDSRRSVSREPLNL